MSVVGRSLKRRGHRVCVFQLSEVRSRIEAEGLEFSPLDVDQTNLGGLASAVSGLGETGGLRGLRFTIGCARRMADLICRCGPAALRARSIDLLLVDQNEPAAGSVAEYLNIPFVNICASLLLNREPAIPPSFLPWNYRPDLFGRLRNHLAYAVCDGIVRPINRTINVYRRRWGLPPIRSPEDTFSRLAQLSQMVPELDFPRAQKPDVLHYLGPFRDNAAPRVSFPYEHLNGKPLVYASFGTLQHRRRGTFELVLEAVSGLDVQLVMAAGPGRRLDKQTLPSSSIIVEYAPQLDILSRAALCITHAGLNTVLDALSCGTPLIALPITHDQPAIAARLQQTGAAEIVPFSKMAPSRLRDLVRSVLTEPRYRQNAARLQECMRCAGGAERAADIIESLLN
jgi:UDP:flavonoid glycosyltransferase YjiC (YdhE family)